MATHKYNGPPREDNPLEMPYVPFLLDRPRKLVLNVNALIELKKLTGKNTLDDAVLRSLFGIVLHPDKRSECQACRGDENAAHICYSIELDPETLRNVLYALLLDEDTNGFEQPPTITPAYVGRFLTPSKIALAQAALMAAFAAQSPDPTRASERPTGAAGEDAQAATT